MKIGLRTPSIAVLISLAFSLLVAPNPGAAAESTVTIVTVSQPTSLNPGTPSDNLIINTEIDYLQRAQFFYVNDRNAIVPNLDLGRYQVVSQNPFKVQYTINSGLVWSDGTPITAVDLLLDHVTCSSRYSIAAGLGNPATTATPPAFNSLCYGGQYSDRHVGLPVISADKMSLTIEYDRGFSDWVRVSPRPFPVHALVLASEGIRQLQSESVSVSAKNRFERAVLGNVRQDLISYGNVWSNSYKLTNTGGVTNPLLFVSSGGYIFDSFTPGQSLTLRYNEKYGAGPAVRGISRLVFRVISDGTAALQALRNREVDVLALQATADTVSQVRAISNVRVVDSMVSVYEHLDLRTGTSPGSNDVYNGVFSGNSQRAKDLRKAFLLTIPRDDIVNNLIKPISSGATRLDSLFYFSNESEYQEVTAASGINVFTQDTQSQREANALALVRQYYPNASAASPGLKVNLLWGTPTNSRRAAVAQLIKASAARAGIEVNAPGVSNWSTVLQSSSWDAAFFAWVRPLSSDRNLSLKCTSCGNNYMGWSNATIDSLEQSLKNENLSTSGISSRLIQAEREIYSNALSLPLFHHPGALGVSASLEGIKPNPGAMPLLWNYWEWTRSGLTPFPRYLLNTPSPTPTPTPTPTPIPTPTPTNNPGISNVKPKPSTPIFSGVNFVGNKINISVNIGTGSNAPDKVYLVAPRLGISANNPLNGTISGATASWSLDFDKALSGNLIPLEIIAERDGVKSDAAAGSYQAPTLEPVVKSVPAAPKSFSSKVVKGVAIINAKASSTASAPATNVFLISKPFGIGKNNAIQGEIVGSKIIIEVPIKAAMAGKKFPVSIYLSNSKGDSKPLNGTVSIPAAAKPVKPVKPVKPSATPKPTIQETIICIGYGQSRPFPGSKCPPGWSEG